eukprot:299345-Pyramimonas_sp.AAC.1
MEDDLVDGACRAASAARAIALENADCKLAAAATNARLKGPVEKASPAPQRGFLRGRNFIDAITLLDTKARAAGIHPNEKPSMALFGFGDAFPSLRVERAAAVLISS